VIPLPRREPLTPEEKQHLRDKAKERLANGAKKTKESDTSGGDSPAHPSGGGAGGGGDRVPSDGGSLPGGVKPPGGGGGGNDSGGKAPGTGREIPKSSKEPKTEYVIDADKFALGLPAFSRLLFKAVNNCLNLFNALPLPFRLEIDDMTTEESELFAQVVRPGLMKVMPTVAKNHPIKVLVGAFVVGIVAKLKGVWKGKKIKPKAGDLESKPEGVE